MCIFTIKNIQGKSYVHYIQVPFLYLKFVEIVRIHRQHMEFEEQREVYVANTDGKNIPGTY